MGQKPKVAFVCVHNSCRSQIAEALGKLLAADVFDSYSAGTETKPQINQDAVRLVKQLYGVDMEQTQHSKLLSDIPPVDVVVTMVCNVSVSYTHLDVYKRQGFLYATSASIANPRLNCSKSMLKSICSL